MSNNKTYEDEATKIVQLMKQQEKELMEFDPKQAMLDRYGGLN